MFFVFLEKCVRHPLACTIFPKANRVDANTALVRLRMADAARSREGQSLSTLTGPVGLTKGVTRTFVRIPSAMLRVGNYVILA